MFLIYCELWLCCNFCFYKKDFVYLLSLKKSIVVKEVTGEQEYFYSGITNIQYIDNQSDIQILRISVFHNLYQIVRFCSPQAYFVFTDKENKINYLYIS